MTSSMHPFRWAACVALTFSFASIVGCASTREVVRSDHGGEIELRGGYVPSMSDAHVRMAEHCGGQFRVLEGPEARIAANRSRRGPERVVYECTRPGLALR